MTIKLSRPPSQEETAELNGLSLQCLELLKDNGFTNDLAQPKALATALRHFIDLYKTQKASANTMAFDKISLAYGMGELYAKAIMEEYQWNYQFLEFEDGFTGFAVVSQHKKWFIAIHHYFHNLLYDAEKNNNSLLNFNMLDPKVLQTYNSTGYTSLS
jgi:hypothetical protein